MVICKSFQSGNNLYSLTACALTCASFYFSTLEEYYTGGLFLGPFNGVSDGSAGIIAIFIGMGFAGNGFWLTNVEALGCRLVDIAVVGVSLG